MKHILEETDISLTSIHDTIHLSSPPWLLKQLVVILDLNKLPKKETHPLIYQEKLNNIQEIYPNYQHIFTDGSKSNFGTGCGEVLHKKSQKKSLPKETFIFSAEIYAINLTLDLISTSSPQKCIIHSDSLSVLQSLKYTKLENPLIVKIFNKLNSLIHSKKVIFCWIPSHIGIQGNDKADSLAKAAINMTPCIDLKPKIKQIVTKKWQQLWDENPHNKLFQIPPILKERKLDPNNTRREKTTLTRLRIGHTQLTHSFILKEAPTKCPCGNHYSIKHILIECTKLNHSWKKFYKANSMKELLKKNCSQKHNQLLKNNWPPIKDIDYVANTFDYQVYRN